MIICFHSNIQKVIRRFNIKDGTSTPYSQPHAELLIKVAIINLSNKEPAYMIQMILGDERERKGMT
jgi:hypothetical protein